MWWPGSGPNAVVESRAKRTRVRSKRNADRNEHVNFADRAASRASPHYGRYETVPAPPDHGVDEDRRQVRELAQPAESSAL